MKKILVELFDNKSLSTVKKRYLDSFYGDRKDYRNNRVKINSEKN